MKRLILASLIIILFSNFSFSQYDYIKYYQLINKTKDYQGKDQTDSLTIFLKQAFDLVDYVHIENLKYGKRIAKKYKDKELLNICNYKIKHLEDFINVELKAQLDSIHNEDQRIRGRKYYKARNYYWEYLKDTTFDYKEKKMAKSKILMEEWWRVDSANVEFIKTTIAEYGFPSEKIVGKNTNFNVSIILLHYDKDTANHIMGKTLKKALKDGSISPKMYAWIIDRHLMNVGKKQEFYSIPTPWVEMNDVDKLRYNKNRYLIGLKSLDKIKIKVKKNSVVVKQ